MSFPENFYQNKHPQTGDISAAIADFRSARNQADLKELIGRITGESTQLLSFDEVKQMLRLQSSVDIGLRDIPLDAIVGSVGRYTDFTKGFLPKREIRPERWARVKVAASGMVGLPPIDVYKIGEVYFVQDGNHRVSVARQLGASHIQAYVTQVQTSVPLTADTSPDDLILKAEYAIFLEKTQLDLLNPKPDLTTTIPGQYQNLLEHIEVHRYYMGLEHHKEVPFIEAASHWFQAVYLPVVETIRKLGILRHFPNRTETDLYLWISKHRAELEDTLGWQIKTEYAASDLAEKLRFTSSNFFSKIKRIIVNLFTSESIAIDQEAEGWREILEEDIPENHLFPDILIPVNGRQDGWHALEQAIIIAQKEKSTLHGLHVLTKTEADDAALIEHVQDTFHQHCNEAKIKGDLAITDGDIIDQICHFAIGSDLVVINLSYPTENSPIARLNAGFHDLVRRCPRPLYIVPNVKRDIHSAILAFDGSPKAWEALYLAAYISRKWQVALWIVNVPDNEQTGKKILDQAREYLAGHEIQAEYMLKEKPVDEAILNLANQLDCDLIIMGGYGVAAILQVLVGSTVDQVLLESQRPLLVCR